MQSLQVTRSKRLATQLYSRAGACGQEAEPDAPGIREKDLVDVEKEPVHGLARHGSQLSAAWGSAPVILHPSGPSFSGVHRKSPTPAREPLR